MGQVVVRTHPFSLDKAVLNLTTIYEPPLGKTNDVVSEQVRHKPSCTSTEMS